MPSRPQAPRWYRVANLLICGFGAWPVLLGVALISDAPTRVLVAVVIAAASGLVAIWFDRAVNRACARSALETAERISAEIRHRRGAAEASLVTLEGAAPRRAGTARFLPGTD